MIDFDKVSKQLVKKLETYDDAFGKLKIEEIYQSERYVSLGNIIIKDELENQMCLFVMFSMFHKTIYLSNGVNRVGHKMKINDSLELEVINDNC